jgi:hypothetical protein
LSPGEQSFLQSLQAGERFSASVEAGAGAGPEPDAADDEFDAAAALQRFVLAGVIVDCL